MNVFIRRINYFIKRIGKHMRDIISSLGNYLKAQATLIAISFTIALIGLYIFKFVGLNVQSASISPRNWIC